MTTKQQAAAGDSRPRLAARFSIFLPMAAFVSSCLYQQLFLAPERPDGIMKNQGYYAFSTVMSVCLLSGLALAAYGLWGALRMRSGGVIALASIGLAVNLAAVAITAVAAAIVAAQ